jgi:dTDP-glucose pyrophosphorylase
LTTGWSKDAGTYEDLMDANKFILDEIMNYEKPRIAGEIDRNSYVSENVIIKPAAKVVL